jgi:hypothetical protein
VETAVRGAVSGLQADVGTAKADAMSALGGSSWAAGPPPPPASFTRRYRPRPSIDDLTQDIERLKRQLALPGATPGARRKFAPRARINRARVRR